MKSGQTILLNMGSQLKGGVDSEELAGSVIRQEAVKTGDTNSDNSRSCLE